MFDVEMPSNSGGALQEPISSVIASPQFATLRHKVLVFPRDVFISRIHAARDGAGGPQTGGGSALPEKP